MKSWSRLIALCLLTAAVAQAQRATEIYIPIGRSPGVSGKSSAIGTCTTVDSKERTVVVRTGDRTWTTKVTERTTIYLDRSRVGLTNTYGTFDDLRGDRQMEIKYWDGKRTSGGACEWIKVRVTKTEGTRNAGKPPDAKKPPDAGKPPDAEKAPKVGR